MNRRLSANLDYAFAALSAEGGAASAAPTSLAISKMVTRRGIEPRLQGCPDPVDTGSRIFDL